MTCYNLIFPIWLLLTPLFIPLSPVLGLITGPVPTILVLAGNFAVDFGVTALALKLQRVEGIKDRVLKVIARVWLLGFAADFLGGLPLLLVMFMYDTLAEAFDVAPEWFYQTFERPICYDSPYTSAPATALVCACLLVSAALIYRFNLKWGLKKAGLTDGQRKKTALLLAMLTAPYAFLLPTNLFFR